MHNPIDTPSGWGNPIDTASGWGYLDIPGGSQAEKGEHSLSNDVRYRAVLKKHKNVTSRDQKRATSTDFAFAVSFVYLV